jgi:hypothetical protein
MSFLSRGDLRHEKKLAKARFPPPVACLSRQTAIFTYDAEGGADLMDSLGSATATIYEIVAD